MILMTNLLETCHLTAHKLIYGINLVQSTQLGLLVIANNVPFE